MRIDVGIVKLRNVFSQKEFIFIIALILICYIKDCLIIFRQNIISGIDGYYYIIQIESFLNQKQFYFPTSTPLVLYFFAFVENLISNSALSIKIGTSFLNFLLLTGLFAIVFECTRKTLYAVIAPLLFSFSGLHLYFLIEYLSQLGGLALLIWSIFFFTRFAKFRQKLWLLPAILFLIGACFSHRSILPIAIVAIFSAALFGYIVSSVYRQNKQHTIYGVIITGLVFVLPVILKLQPFFKLPFNLQNEITVIPQFPSHFATLPEIIILLVLIPIFLWLLVYQSNNKIDNAGKIFFGSVAIFTLLITLNPFISSVSGFVSLGGRLRTIACLQAALLLPALLWLLQDYSKIFLGGIILFAAPLFLWSFLAPLPHGAQPEYLTYRASLIESLSVKNPVIEKQSLIVADHGDQFVATYITGLPSSQNFPKEMMEYNTIYWLLRGMPETFVDDSMIPLFTDKSGKLTVLVKHNKFWEKRLTNSDVRRHLISANPHLYFYITQSNIKQKF